MPLRYENAETEAESIISDEQLWYIVQEWIDNQEEFKDFDDDKVKDCTDIIISMLEETEQYYHPSTYLDEFDDEDIAEILEKLSHVEEE